MRKIVLHGRLKKLFGGPFNLNVATAGEAVRALAANFPQRFLEALSEGSYEVIRGKRSTGMRLVEEHINEFRLGSGDLHIVPVTAGSKKSGGILKTILGVALIGVAIFASGGTLAAPLAGLTAGSMWGTVAMLGVSMALTGVSQMLAKKEQSKDETKKEESFSFSGPGNNTEQGNPVPLIYGRVMTGSLPISFGIDVEDIPIGAVRSGTVQEG
ncbi:tail assembly protein [Methylobacterium sp. AMS5]|uniref:tail assembly protein n=1 Tax=Methylobacterium sp. AMS5 TaxID=925818 RepID=UPI00074F9869|nr:tail assembly protein [Methylobacterium sp. AMS5]AMB48255.1 hypothetical protein Y590_25140 [Methylobacterium sp. AMS5]